MRPLQELDDLGWKRSARQGVSLWRHYASDHETHADLAPELAHLFVDHLDRRLDDVCDYGSRSRRNGAADLTEHVLGLLSPPHVERSTDQGAAAPPEQHPDRTAEDPDEHPDQPAADRPGKADVVRAFGNAKRTVGAALDDCCGPELDPSVGVALLEDAQAWYALLGSENRTATTFSTSAMTPPFSPESVQPPYGGSRGVVDPSVPSRT
jgi:hypothetical protein